MLAIFHAILGSQIAQAIIVTIFTALFGRYLQPRGRLVWGFSHQHIYLVPRIDGDGNYPVRTQQIWIQNVGRRSVEDIEFVLNWRPQHLEIWDPRHYVPTVLGDGRYSLQFPNLSSHEAFTISLLDTFKELPIVVAVRWKDGIAKQVPMGPQQIFPRGLIYLIRFLLIVGAAAILFLLLQAVLSLCPPTWFEI